MSIVSLDYIDTLDTKNEKKVLEFSTDLLPTSVNIKSLFVAKVDGQSMEPVIKNRMLVVADLSQNILEDQEIYLVHYNDRMWIKQAKKEALGIKLISINKAFSHLVYREDEVRVIAKVILSFE